MAYIPFLNNAYFAAKVGIGTDAPSEKLEVQDGNIKIETTTNIDAELILNPFSSGLGTSYQWEIVGKSSSGNYNLQIREGGTPYVTIDSSVNGNAGNVGIGTTSPSAKLEVFKSGGTVFNVLGSLGQLFSVTDNLSGEIFAVADISGVPIMSINSSGSIKFGSYSGTNQTGTPTYILGTTATGDVVKVLGTDVPGSVSGSGTLRTIPMWTPDGDTLGNSVLKQDVANQNIGLGVTPETDMVTYVAQLRIGEQSALQGHTDGVGADSFTCVTTNWKFATGGSEFINGTVAAPGFAHKYQQQSGDHSFSCSTVAGVAGATITERPQMVIKQSGNVGIGITSPTKQLHLLRTTGDVRGIMVETTVAASYAELQVKAASEFRIGTGGSSTTPNGQFYVYDATAGAHRFDIDANGNVGINNISPVKKLDVVSTVEDAAGEMRLAGILASDNLPFGKINFANTATANTQTNDILAYIAGEKVGSSNRGELTFATSDAASPTEKMRIDKDGNVGIGETDPNSRLIIKNTSANDGIRIHTSDTAEGFLIFRDDSGTSPGAVVYDHSIDMLGFKVNGFSDRLVIVSDGDVGINNTLPDFKLHIKGTLGVSDLPFNTDSVSVLVAKETLGAELITNGNFSVNTGWGVGSGWTISGGKASVDTASTVGLTQSISVVSGNVYKVSVEISNYTSGSLQPQFGGSQVIASINANGKYVYTVTSTVTNTVFYLYAVGDAEFSVDNVSIKQVTSANDQIQKREISADAFLPANGPYLPLTAGSGFPLSGDLYLNDSKFIRLRTTSGSNGNASIDFSTGAALTFTVNSSSAPIIFKQSSTEWMRIIANGNVGINDTSPDFKLDVSGTFGVSDIPANATSTSVLVKDETLGPELVSNKNFATSVSGWNVQNSSTVTGGIGTINATGSLASTGGNWSIYQTAVFTPNKKYLANYTVRRVSGTGTFQIAYSYGIFVDQTLTSSFQTFSVYYDTNSNNWPVLSMGGNTSGDVFEISYISVKQVTSASDQIKSRELGEGAFVDTEYWKADGNNIHNTNSGNVGIGTDSPDTKLMVSGEILSENANAGYFISTRVASGSSRPTLNFYGTALDINYVTGYAGGGASTAISIESGGDVGIGTTSPNPFNWGSKHLTCLAEGTNKYFGLDIIGSGNGAGAIIFGGGSGSGTATNIARAQISALDGSHLRFYTNATNSGSSFTERMVIQSGGNVGIGTTTPLAKLDIQGTQGQLFSVTDDLSGEIFAVADISGVPIMTVNSSGVSYFAGNVGIGVASPGFATIDGFAQRGLEIKGAKESGTGPVIRLQETGSGKGAFEIRSTRNASASGNYLAFGEAADTFMVIRSDDDDGGVTKRGNVGIGTNGPSGKLEVIGSTKLGGSLHVSTDASYNTAASYTFRDAVNINNPNSTSAVTTGSSVMSIGASSGNPAFTSLVTTGAIGIGTSSPTERLEVNGNSITLNKTRGIATNYATSEGWVEAAASTFTSQVGYFGGLFTINGPAAENKIEYSIGPFNTSELVWMSVPETASNDDGGWNKSMSITFPNSANNGMMSVVYVRRDTGSPSGTFYHGCRGGSTNNLDGSNASNPYFCNFAISVLPLDIWCVSIGIIYAANDDTTTGSPLTGTYRMDTGEKLHTGVTYRQKPSNTDQQQRVYHYYSTSPTAQLDFARPGFYVTDGSEPTLNELTAGAAGGSDVFWSANGNDIYNDNSGNVGIGVTSPAVPLEIRAMAGNPYAALRLSSDSGNKWWQLNTMFSNTNPDLFFAPNGAAATVVFQADGDVGIGTDNALAKLDVRGQTQIRGSLLGVTVAPSSTGADMYFYHNNNPTIYLQSNGPTILNAGNVGINTTTPQVKLEVKSANHSEFAAHFGQGQVNSSGVFGGISLGYSEANTAYRKVALVAKALGDNAARQNLHFLVDVANDGGSAQLIDTKMMIDGLTGNVGIGTTSPGTLLQVGDTPTSGGSPFSAYGFDGAAQLFTTRAEGNFNTALYLYNNPVGEPGTGTGIMFRARSSTTDSQQQATVYSSWTTNTHATRTAKLVFQTANSGAMSDKMTILGNGNVGIGIDAPVAKLHVENRSATSPFAINAQMLIGYNGGSQNFFDADLQYFRNAAFQNILQLSGDGIVGTPNNTQRLRITTDYTQIGPVPVRYPYYRTDSFKSDGSGYFYAFGHEKSDGTQSISMMFNDGASGNKYTRVINNLQLSSFVTNEVNGQYPSFTTNVSIKNSGDSYFNGGKVGIGITGPNSRLSVLGVIQNQDAYADPSFTVTSVGMSVVGSGALQFTQGWAGTSSAGDTVVFRYNAASWKSWSLDYTFASTNGMVKGTVGGYNNNSGGYNNSFLSNQFGLTCVVTNVGQSVVVTFTGNFGVHMMCDMRYSQGGGDGAPQSTRAFLTYNS